MPKPTLNVRDYNRYAWNRQVDINNKFTLPVDPQTVAAARKGEFSVLLTETNPVPREWFPSFQGLNLLGLACGGGQQGPVFAALGANVTIFDNSPAQLERDRQVASREGLNIRTVEGDMRDLSAFADETFDLVFHPVSNVFCPEVRPVWREAFRVLRHGGLLLAGFANPIYYMFGTHADEQKTLQVRYAIPYSDLNDMEPEELDICIEEGIPLEFGHSLTDLIAGQTDAGFVITGFYEDICPDSPLSKYHPAYIATRAVKS
ncbi:MAG: class I SAM-dependent methyltransferase [Candidatus Atribacteria bacterium]|nr:class I SAM-dependent methyltransferase [Candidatus Atribacteria bacterium]